MSRNAADLARGWIEAWIRMDIAWLRRHLAPAFVHTSPFGRLEGREHYLETVEPLARKSVSELVVREVVGSGDRAAIWFENHTPGGIVPTCDWIRTEGEAIVEVRSFYDASAVRDVLSEDDQGRLGAGPDDRAAG